MRLTYAFVSFGIVSEGIAFGGVTLEKTDNFEENFEEFEKGE
jgi:hypothetical protein